VPISGEEPLWTLIDRIYESVERPELWPETIYALGEFVGGRRDFWGIPYPSGAGCHGTLLLSRKDLAALDRYIDEFGDLIIRFLKVVFLSILSCQDQIEKREATGVLLAYRYLPAFTYPASSTSPYRPALRKIIAGLWEDGRMFNAENMRYMSLILPHLDRAVRLQMRFNAFELRTEMVSGALDYVTLGVILIDRSGQALWFNRQARQMLEESNALRLSGGRFCAKEPRETGRIRDMIEQTITGKGHGLLTIDRGSDARPLLVIVLPLKPQSGDPSDRSAGVLFLSDPDRSDRLSVEALRQAFNLTNREAHVVIAIAQGQGLQAAADVLGVAPTTVRSQLQQAFAKTGTSHQAELAALVHKTLTPLRYR
jgi:DNA-binding CsgD family transcriptional regulator